jgi:hypothetical protein
VVVLGWILLSYLTSFCLKQTRGFTITAISSDLTYQPHWETSPLSAEERSEVKEILQQRFSFLGRGQQCYAFVSEDGRFVIKFFRFHRRRLPAILRTLPLPSFLKSYREQAIAAKKEKLESEFASCKLAFEELREETGVLLVHLNKTGDLHQQLRLVDRLGIEHLLDLDTKEFVLQKRVTLAHAEIDRLVDERGIEEAKRAIDSIFEVIVRRSKKGVYDEDAFISHNFGFYEGKAVILDVGRLVKDPERMRPEVYRPDIETIVRRFIPWLERHHPELVAHVEQRMQEIQ